MNTEGIYEPSGEFVRRAHVKAIEEYRDANAPDMRFSIRLPVSAA